MGVCSDGVLLATERLGARPGTGRDREVAREECTVVPVGSGVPVCAGNKSRRVEIVSQSRDQDW
jgi:hypothetical protein